MSMLRRLAVVAAAIALPIVIGFATVGLVGRSDPPGLPELIHVGEDSPLTESGSATTSTPAQTTQPPVPAPDQPPPASPVPPPPPVDDDGNDGGDDDGVGDSGDD